MAPMRQAEKKKRPRTCAGCGEESPKRELLRVVRAPDGTVAYDPSGRANGRGVYVCRQIECIKLAKKKKSFSRMLKVQVDDLVYDELERVCEASNQDG